MKKYTGTEKAAKGAYLNLSNWDFTQVEEENDILPGDVTVRYYKVPTALAMIAGPFTGLLFLVFLPFVGIAGFLGFVFYKALKGVQVLGVRTAEVLVYRWQPGRAYFTRDTKGQAKTPEKEAELDELEREINERKQQDEA